MARSTASSLAAVAPIRCACSRAVRLEPWLIDLRDLGQSRAGRSIAQACASLRAGAVGRSTGLGDGPNGRYRIAGCQRRRPKRRSRAEKPRLRSRPSFSWQVDHSALCGARRLGRPGRPWSSLAASRRSSHLPARTGPVASAGRAASSASSLEKSRSARSARARASSAAPAVLVSSTARSISATSGGSGAVGTA